jgi:hypothetical protein
MQTWNFGALIILGTKELWLSDLRNYLENEPSCVITNPMYEKRKMRIYQMTGFDFIFAEVDFNEIADVIATARKLRKFLPEKNYLTSQMLFFLNYMSPKFRQVLEFLSIVDIKTTLVSLKPGNLTLPLYLETCSDLNLRTIVHSAHHLDSDQIATIIRKCFDDDVLEDFVASLQNVKL